MANEAHCNTQEQISNNELGNTCFEIRNEIITTTCR